MAATLAEVRSGPHEGFRVCERCIATRDFDAKMQAHAARLEEQAQELRGLMGQLDVPTFEEFQAAETAYRSDVREQQGLTAPRSENRRP